MNVVDYDYIFLMRFSTSFGLVIGGEASKAFLGDNKHSKALFRKYLRIS